MTAEQPRHALKGETDEAAEFLANLTQEFASSLDIDDTLNHAVDRFMDHLQAEAASIFLFEDADSTLVCRECAGPVDIRGLRLAPDQGIVGQTVMHNEAKTLLVLGALASKVGIKGIFSDWPGTVTYYANCMAN